MKLLQEIFKMTMVEIVDRFNSGKMENLLIREEIVGLIKAMNYESEMRESRLKSLKLLGKVKA